MKQVKKRKRQAKVYKEECAACGCCVLVCPHDAITVYKGLYAAVDESFCMGCGKCVKECPASVITLSEVTA
ncbi:MAG: 4Fe-4S binding protein [Clostridia bacterium]|jgi:ferredoxin|nr:4Fe-4S binding protein [Clostridiaceae bacterium]